MSVDEPFEFKRKTNFEQRATEANKILKKYIDRIPIICEPSANSRILTASNTKFIVPRKLTMMNFVNVIRNRLTINHKEALFFMVDKKIIRMDILIEQLYEIHKSADGFLYISYKEEDVYGV